MTHYLEIDLGSGDLTTPLLSLLEIHQILVLYLATTDLAIVVILFRKLSRKQLPMLCKSRYPNIKKLTYSLVVYDWNLRAYFESYSINVYMNHPLYQILHKIDQLERLLKWLIELSGYEVNILPRAIIKGQALVDFVVEMSFSKWGQLDPEKINNTKL